MGKAISLLLVALGIISIAVGNSWLILGGNENWGQSLASFIIAIVFLTVAIALRKSPKCPDCGGEVVRGARKCKNCGAELKS